MYPRPCWIFDLDGTLTAEVHDFRAMRKRLGFPPDLDLLEGLARLDDARRSEAEGLIAAWEWEHAELARPAEGIPELLAALANHGARVGVLTRNLRDVALRTLEVAGLREHFDAPFVLGRLDAAPKPSPEGLLRLLGSWRAVPHEAVMVGDYLHDVQAGRAAGVATVLIGRRPPAAWSPFVDLAVPHARALLDGWPADAL